MKKRSNIRIILNDQKLAIYCYFLVILTPTILNYISDIINIGIEHKELFYNYNYVTFLVGNGITQVFQYIILWLLPLWCIYLFSKNIIVIIINEIDNLFIIRNKKSVFNLIIKIIVVSFMTTLIIYLTNYIITFLLFHGGADSIYGAASTENIESIGTLEKYEYMNPMLANIIYIFIMSITSALLTGYGIIFAYIEKNPRKLLLLIFVPWIIAILTNYSIVDVFQPFTEYGLKYKLIAYIKFNILYIITIFGLYVFNKYKMRKE